MSSVDEVNHSTEAKMATQYVTDETGTYIAATQRPDGTWRKARRVRDGYVPQDEVPLYESKGKQWAKNKPDLPPGLHPDDVAKAQAAKNATANKIPGLVQSEPTSKSGKKKKKKKQQNQTENGKMEQEISERLNSVHFTSSNSVNIVDKMVQKKGVQPIATDPAKRIKNLRKKLREIETLKQKLESGELINPEKDQLDKIARKSEIEMEIQELELELENK
ncbi:partner of Y14 and mago B [Centruroides vittatus]|uniref:partner of Y14 and mago B n=1 Tax=Centruroides vittatus TaxID=120091 RepID=UPI0035105DD9